MLEPSFKKEEPAEIQETPKNADKKGQNAKIGKSYDPDLKFQKLEK